MLFLDVSISNMGLGRVKTNTAVVIALLVFAAQFDLIDVYQNIVGCRNKAVQYDMILHTAL